MKFGAVALATLLAAASSSGCMGWGDMFTPHREVAGGYYLILDSEDVSEPRPMNLFACRSDAVAGGYHVHEIGWNDDFILFTEDESPTSWQAIRLNDQRTFAVQDIERRTDARFRSIGIMKAADAWEHAGPIKHLNTC